MTENCFKENMDILSMINMNKSCYQRAIFYTKLIVLQNEIQLMIFPLFTQRKTDKF